MLRTALSLPIFSLVLLVLLACGAVADLDNGFGKSIAWRSFEGGLAEAATTFDLGNPAAWLT